MKTLFPFVFAVFIQFTAFSQNNSSNQVQKPSTQSQNSDGNSTDPVLYLFQYGIQFMPTIGKIPVNPMPDGVIQPATTTISYSGGLFLGYAFSNTTGIRAELLYSTISQNYQDRILERDIRLDYLNIPLLLTLNTGINDPINISFEVGPQLGINIGKSMTSSGPNIIGESVVPTGILLPNRLNLAAAYGVGVDFPLNSKRTYRLGFGYRGSFGLTNEGSRSQKLSANEYYILDNSQMRTYSIFTKFSFAF